MDLEETETSDVSPLDISGVNVNLNDTITGLAENILA